MIARTFFRTASSAAALIVIGLTSTAAHAQQCTEESFEEANYIVCAIDQASSDLRLFWKNDQDEPYRTFSKVADALSEQGLELVLAVNAGMYRPDFSPLGLYVENGAVLQPADTKAMKGSQRQIPNFYKKPNGIFFLGDAGAGILSTDEFLGARPNVRFATQSGPLLVIGNELHPALIPGSTDRTRRSGVGVCEDGKIRFAISNGDVNFHEFARLFRDELACPDALFLDGGRGAGLYVPGMGRNDFSWHGGYGPVFGLVEHPARPDSK